MREFGPRGHSATSSHNGGSRHRALLRARRWRPRRRSAAEKRDELAPLQLIQLHSVPASRGQITGYRIGEDQSGDNETILQPVGRSLCSRWYCSILFSTEILFATRPMFKSRFQIAGEALAIAALSASAAAQNPQAPINTLTDLEAALLACWVPPPMEQSRLGMQITVLMSFKRNGHTGAALTFWTKGATATNITTLTLHNALPI